MRKVRYYCNVRNPNSLDERRIIRVVGGEGWLHGWAQESNEDGQYVVGIIEKPDGKMTTILIDDIEFVAPHFG